MLIPSDVNPAKSTTNSCPIAIPTKLSVETSRSANRVEELNQEIESLVLRGICGNGNRKTCHRIPEDHRAPVNELHCSQRTVKTKTVNRVGSSGEESSGLSDLHQKPMTSEANPIESHNVSIANTTHSSLSSERQKISENETINSWDNCLSETNPFFGLKSQINGLSSHDFEIGSVSERRRSALFGSIECPTETRDRAPLTTTITRVENSENDELNVTQQFVSQSQQMGGQGSQPIHVISQIGSDLTKLRPMNTTVMSQQQPRHVYLAVQQTLPQHFIQIQSQSQQRTPSNIIIQQKSASHSNVQLVRLQQAPQQIIIQQQNQSGAQLPNLTSKRKQSIQLTPPTIKRRLGTGYTLSSQSQEIIRNVYNYFGQSEDRKMSILAQTSDATNVSQI